MCIRDRSEYEPNGTSVRLRPSTPVVWRLYVSVPHPATGVVFNCSVTREWGRAVAGDVTFTDSRPSGTVGDAMPTVDPETPPGIVVATTTLYALLSLGQSPANML